MKLFTVKVVFFLSLFQTFWMPQPTFENDSFTIIKYPELEAHIQAPSDQLRIYNFWATWCAPCIKEMPHFESLASADPKVSLFFISMDDGRKPERVTSFIEKRQIQHPVLLLDDVDFNAWIDKIDPSWSGAIPATLFVKANGETYFHEGELSETALSALISTYK
ncbi:MAG: TlpA family protein disulfide reductase [Nitritalea sp.]